MGQEVNALISRAAVLRQRLEATDQAVSQLRKDWEAHRRRLL